MNPLSLLAAAQAAYAGIQTAIAAGKEIQSMAQDLSELWGNLARLTALSVEKPLPSIFSNKTAEQIAIEKYTAKAEVQDLAEKAKNLFIGKFGLAAWDQVQREVINIRKEIEREKLEQEKAQDARLEEIKEAAVVSFIVFLILGIMFVGAGFFLIRG